VPKRLTTEEFIEKAKRFYSNCNYDYSKAVYKNNSTKVTVICPIHKEFFPNARDHYEGKASCPKCAGIFKDTEEWVEEVIRCNPDNQYDYSNTVYQGTGKKVTIFCKTHGSFEQTPGAHLRGQGCPKCWEERRGKSLRISKEEFLKRSFEMHNGKYSYEKVDFECLTKEDIEIYCTDCKRYFFRNAYRHMHGVGCPDCILSNNENYIKYFFERNNIDFIQQKKFDDCRGKRNKLPFDFYLPVYNVLIEYQGKQHFQLVERFGEEAFKAVQITDKIKKEYCLKNNILLFEITYLEKTDQRLSELLSIISPR
jgi:hypothetical protein